jgi:VIT1/CCC1 family predicted Fe2+/Mn2+ transporter
MMKQGETVETIVVAMEEPAVIPKESRDDADSHKEPHFGNAQIIRDIIVGLSDGLTVPFALAAGLASIDDSALVVTAGLAEIVAGSIAMGLGGYLAGQSELEHYDSERLREAKEVVEVPEREIEEIYEIFDEYKVTKEALHPLIEHLKANPEIWVDFMMKYELGLERPDKRRTWISASSIGLSYLVGGLIPIFPYIFIKSTRTALYISSSMTIVALFIFGYFKSHVFGTPNPIYSAVRMTMVGALAAGAAFGIAYLIQLVMPVNIK